MSRQLIIAALLGMLDLEPATYAQEKVEAAEGRYVTRDSFTCFVPENWVEIPADLLAKLNRDRAAHGRTTYLVGLTTGYGLDFLRADLSSVPRLMVSSHSKGVNQDALLTLTRLSAISGATSGLEGSKKIGAPVYDEKAKTIWLRESRRVVGVGQTGRAFCREGLREISYDDEGGLVETHLVQFYSAECREAIARGRRK